MGLLGLFNWGWFIGLFGVITPPLIRGGKKPPLFNPNVKLTPNVFLKSRKKV